MYTLLHYISYAFDRVATIISVNNAVSLSTVMIYSWAGGKEAAIRLLCGTPRRMLLAFAVIGLSFVSIGKALIVFRAVAQI